MARDEKITETVWNEIKLALSFPKLLQKDIAERYGISAHTVSDVKKSISYEDYRKTATEKLGRAKERAKAKAKPTGKDSKAISIEQDIHDLAREARNIKSILMKIAEAWEVKI